MANARIRGKPNALRILVSAALPIPIAAIAGVTLDGTLGAAGPIGGPNYSISAALGRQVGANLFHSFSIFNVGKGEIATFSGPASTANVIGRVTGGSPSSIEGMLRSNISGANLFLLNPSGIVFGPGASLDVSGSFFASAAHYLRLADGGRFDVANPANTVLTAADPVAFGFLGTTGGISAGAVTLGVGQGQRLGLIGGDVSLSGTTLSAPSGKVFLVSTAGAGEARVFSSSLELGAGVPKGAITISGATLDAGEPVGATSGGGSIFLRSGELVVENSAIRAKTVNGAGGKIDVAITGAVSINGGEVTAVTTGAGNAGSIALEAARFQISRGALVDTSADPGSTGGNGGSLAIVASESVGMIGTTDNSAGTAVVSNTFGPGRAGPISISAPLLSMSNDAVLQSNSDVGASGAGNNVTLNLGSLLLSGGAQIDSSTRTGAPGGTLDVKVSGPIVVSGSRTDAASAIIPTGIFANAYSTGAGGRIQISAGSLDINSGGQISSSNQAGASGGGGSITANVSGDMKITGQDANGKASVIAANTFGIGNAGAIDLSANVVRVDGGRIQSVTEAAGKGKEISVKAARVELINGGQISASAFSSGDSGSVVVRATQSVSISGLDSGVFVRTEVNPSAPTTPTAAGGNMQISAPTVSLTDSGGLFAISGGMGAGGKIRVDASTIELNSGARMSSQAFVTGNAGDISIESSDKLSLNGGSITTEALSADGGNIDIRAGNRVSLNHGRITATVGGGLGNGGNIFIDPIFVTLNHSDIIANAFGGRGGNIAIAASNFYRSPDSVVSASSQLGLSGTVVIQSQATDLSGSLRALPSDYSGADLLLAARCPPRLAGKANSLVVAGRGALPLEPAGLLGSRFVFAAAGETRATAPTHIHISAQAPLLAALPPSCAR